MRSTLRRREFLTVTGGAAATLAGLAAHVATVKRTGAVAPTAAGQVPSEAGDPSSHAASPSSPAKSRVVVFRHPDLAAGAATLTADLVRGFLDEAAAVLAGESRPADAWAHWFRPRDRVAIKVNCLGLPTHPAVGEALARAIVAAEIAPAGTVLWDRTDRELDTAGYTLQKGGRAARCYGTDSLGDRGRGGYDAEVSASGEIGSLYSRIVTEECDALVSAAVLKDHNLAGLSCALKNFFGSVHNPNKYHDNGCDPFVADVCAHQHIRGRLRLAVCDATRPQYHGGPPRRPRWQWPYGGIIIATDPVALDRVALEIIERKRAQEGMRPLAAENRPVRYLASAAARGLGNADLAEIEVTSVGRPWLDVA